MGKWVTAEQKRAAVALAALVGADEAAAQLGFDRRSVRTWAEQFGKRPELDAPTDELQGLYDMAVAKVTADVATGRIKGSALMTVVGVARDKLDRARRQKAQDVADSGSAIAAYDRFADWLADTLTAEPIESEEALEASVAAAQAVVPKLLLRRANAESADPGNAPSPHRLAILAWFSGRQEIPAGDVLTWAQDQVRDVIERHGSIVAWHAFQQAEEEREQVRQEAEMAEIQARAAALRAGAEGAIHDAEVRAREAAAELSRRPRI